MKRRYPPPGEFTVLHRDIGPDLLDDAWVVQCSLCQEEIHCVNSDFHARTKEHYKTHARRWQRVRRFGRKVNGLFGR